MAKIDSTGPGWREIVAPLILYCEKHQLEVLQVKEKFGYLRFYYGLPNTDRLGGDETLDRMIEHAELRSGDTCEWCGAPGVKRSTGWVKVLCDVHFEQWNQGKRWRQDV
jgi:hypothetical protein